tara:strand:+ start:357 stop:539 length:183 start_codon:yes stop_codon:yes gene_type:complete
MIGEITILVSFSILFILSLYLFIRGVEYRESVERLIKQIEQLREANQNLSQIIQDEIERE